MEEIEKFKQFFQTEDGRKCHAKLLIHADRHLGRYRRYSGQDIGPEPSDAVNEAILRVLNGSRKWKSDWMSNIEPILKMVIRSVINHSFDTTDSTRTDRLPENEGHVSSPINSEINGFTEGLRIPTPEELLLSEKESADFSDKILEGLKDDPELEELALCFMDGLSKPQDIAGQLGISVSDVNNRKKRLRRKLTIIYNKPNGFL